jgi:hypothetical protein
VVRVNLVFRGEASRLLLPALFFGFCFPWPLGPRFCSPWVIFLVVDVCLQAFRAVGVSSSRCSTGGGCFVLFVFSFFCFALSLLVQAEAFGFWIVEIDGCWRMAGGDVVQS